MRAEGDVRRRILQAEGTTTMVEATTASSSYVIALSSVAAIGGFLFGFDSGVINGAVDALAHAFGTRAATTGFAVASVLLGCAVGAFVAGTVADRYGRRPTMLLNAVLFLISAVASGTPLPRSRAARSGSISMTVSSFGRSASFSVSTPSPGPISRISSSGAASTAATMREICWLTKNCQT